MLKRFFILITVMMTITSQVQASSQSSLKAIFDDFNYAITVEWDQKDRDFYDAQLNKLSEEIEKIQNSGVTHAEMLTMIASELKSDRLKQELQPLMASAYLNKISPNELNQKVSQIIERDYARGASWNGEVILGVGVIIFAVTFLTFWGIALGKCLSNPESETSCSSSTSCSEIFGCADEVVCGCSVPRR